MKRSSKHFISKHLDEGQKITLSFNEYIKEESLKNSIELFPGVDEKIISKNEAPSGWVEVVDKTLKKISKIG